MAQAQVSLLNKALFFSFFLHLSLLICLPQNKIPFLKKDTKMSVVYRVIPPQLNRHENKEEVKNFPVLRERELDIEKAPLSAKEEISKINKERLQFDPLKALERQKVVLPSDFQRISQEKRADAIKLKDLSEEVSHEPAYLRYRDIVRKRVQDRVYSCSDDYLFFDNPRLGKVFVTFTVKSDGTLKDVSILDYKSSQDGILKDIVKTAIQSAVPFDRFPADLKYDERVFNLEVSFEME